MDSTPKRKRSVRIISKPDICHGHPVIAGTRIMVRPIADFLANGDSVDDVLEAYPGLTRDDVSACIAYASRVAEE